MAGLPHRLGGSLRSSSAPASPSPADILHDDQARTADRPPRRCPFISSGRPERRLSCHSIVALATIVETWIDVKGRDAFAADNCDCGVAYGRFGCCAECADQSGEMGATTGRPSEQIQGL